MHQQQPSRGDACAHRIGDSSDVHRDMAWSSDHVDAGRMNQKAVLNS
jgi:hypothetical protein